MKIETIRENTNYQKINGAFIINKNDDEYKAALMRRKRVQKQNEFDNRLTLLEDKIDKIFTLLMSKT